MEGNKDEAEKCIQLALKYLQDGHKEKAEKLLLKSERLYPTNKAKEYLEKIKESYKSEDIPRDRKPNLKKEEQPFRTTENMDSSDANKDHADAVKRIKGVKNYYDMLGVKKDASDNEIKKAYKKLALQLHPDKNKCPGAAEAFKTLGNAAGVLTDPEKRKQYDLYGTDEERMSHMHRDGETFHTRTFEADVTAEELFNMFFGAGFPPNQFNVRNRNGRMYRQQETHHRDGNANNSGFLVQILPILVLILFSMMGSFFVSDPIFSLHHSNKFPVQRKTLNLKVPYYVKESFPNEYQGSLRRLEMSVEEEYVNNLRHACYKEKTYRDSLLFKARSFNDRELYQRAQNQELPSCNALSNLHQNNG